MCTIESKFESLQRISIRNKHRIFTVAVCTILTDCHLQCLRTILNRNDVWERAARQIVEHWWSRCYNLSSSKMGSTFRPHLSSYILSICCANVIPASHPPVFSIHIFLNKKLPLPLCWSRGRRWSRIINDLSMALSSYEFYLELLSSTVVQVENMHIIAGQT